MIVLGFTDIFKQELPMEYAVELNQLLKQRFLRIISIETRRLVK